MKLFFAGFSLAFLIFAGLACSNPRTGTQSTTDDSAGPEALGGQKWSLIELQGQPVPVTEPNREPHLVFADQRVSGSTGCNRITGTVEFTERAKIKFQPLATTKMACPDMDLEGRFLSVLELADNYQVSNDLLLLNQGETLIARFKASPQN
jgi:heat shock protein HslJ